MLATTRADVNGLVRKRLNARKASFAPMDDAVALTGMEYGGITPIGLPEDWPLLVDAAVAAAPAVVIGSGVRHSKLALPGALAARLPGAEVVEGLAALTARQESHVAALTRRNVAPEPRRRSLRSLTADFLERWNKFNGVRLSRA